MKGIRLLAATQPKSRKIAGLGKFSSGATDLGSNEKHLLGFGRWIVVSEIMPLA
jgi:hypothetical protein